MVSCKNCNTKEASSETFKRCGRCQNHKQVYCCKICQKKDWNKHKGECFTPDERVWRKTIAKETKLRTCKVCAKSKQTTQREVKSCSKCRQVYYCSIGCQNTDWKEHKTMCDLLFCSQQEGQGRKRSGRKKPKKILLPAQLMCQKQVVLLQRSIKDGDKLGQAMAYTNLGEAYYELTHDSKALDCYNKALPLYLEVGTQEGAGFVYRNRAATFHRQGDFFRAQRDYLKYKAVAVEIKSDPHLAAAFIGLANCSLADSDYKESIRMFTNALKIGKKLGKRALQNSALGGLGVTYLHAGHFDTAKVHFKLTIDLALAMGDRKGEALSYYYIGKVMAKQGQLQEALKFHSKHLQISLEIGDRDGEALASRELAKDHARLGNASQAEVWRQKALIIQQELDTFVEVFSLPHPQR
jgi:tetratricopeptide (TPR) repeat protein